MRVLQVIVTSAMAGGPRVVQQICRGISPDFEIHIAAPPQEACGGALRECARGFVPLPARRFDPIAFVRVCDHILAHGIDVVHGHGKGGGIYARLAGLVTGRPVVYTFHGIFLDPFPRLTLAAERFLARCTRATIHVSAGEYEQARSLGITRRARVIPNGVDLSKFGGVTRAEARAALGFPEQARVVGMIGRKSRQKNFEQAFAAMRELPEAILVVIGEGAHEPRSGVAFLGERADVPALLPGFDAFLNTSRWEGMALSILEAMAAGVPVVATDVVGNRDLVLHEKTGLLVRSEDPASTAAGVRRVLQDPLLARSLAAEAKKMVQDRFTVGRMVRETEEVYRAVTRPKAA